MIHCSRGFFVEEVYYVSVGVRVEVYGLLPTVEIFSCIFVDVLGNYILNR